MNFPIYLDNAATTQVHPMVLDAMLPYFIENYGNSGSQQHLLGWQADEAIEKSRKVIANYFQVKSRQIIFTSGATESNNLAIQGYLKNFPQKGHLITSKTEHKSVLAVFEALENAGWDVTYLPVNQFGEIELKELENSIQSHTRLISLMWVNNETGLIHPIEDVCQIAKEKNIVFHCDATQALGKIDISKGKLPDLISFSGHKIYGPKGIGGLVISNQDIKIYPLVYGGDQERGLRSGTLPTQQIVGLSKAFELISELLTKNEFYSKWKNRIADLLTTKFSEFVQINSSDHSVPSILNFSIKRFDWEEMFQMLSKLALSNGSACNAKSQKPSYVLLELGVPSATAFSSIRLSMGYFTTEEEMEFALAYFEQQLNLMK